MSITTSCQDVLRGAQMDLRTGIPEEYWEVVDRFRAELLQQAYAILKSTEDAEDVVQETFCEAFRDQNKLSGDSLPAMLRSINRCNALNRLRDNGRARTRVERKKVHAPTRAFTTGGFSGIVLRDAVQKGLKKLPHDLRRVVELRYFEHLSYKEIAERLGVAQNSVGAMLSRAELLLVPGFMADDESAGGGKGSNEG
ncbi:MAG TPA: sigma-70 family RNA polymerase sigma factor [Planctomycetota bacterium]|nr:sigma-70 family RNA polymerase sigma factor [Planctomycetota bacterium]